MEAGWANDRPPLVSSLTVGGEGLWGESIAGAMVLRWFRSSTGKSALPRPTGPFTVGFVDYEWRPTKTAHTQSPPSYILARIYYPSLPVTKHEESEEMEPEWRGRSHWIPSPAYFPGYGYYLKMPWYVASPLFRLMAGNTPIWAVENAPPTPSSWLPRLPLIIFSHGLAGIRTTYATICTDLASQGYIVAAIEHRYDTGQGRGRGASAFGTGSGRVSSRSTRSC